MYVSTTKSSSRWITQSFFSWIGKSYIIARMSESISTVSMILFGVLGKSSSSLSSSIISSFFLSSSLYFSKSIHTNFIFISTTLRYFNLTSSSFILERNSFFLESDVRTFFNPSLYFFFRSLYSFSSLQSTAVASLTYISFKIM